MDRGCCNGDNVCKLEKNHGKGPRRHWRFALCAAVSPRARRKLAYYVTVAGLGGEPDYEQRFTAIAKDLDKVFKASGSEAHVYTLTGADSNKAQMTETLAKSRATPSRMTISC